MNSTQAITTPTSSSRPSLDTPQSASGSPNPNPNTMPPLTVNKRANRAALREYYNLKKASGASTPTLEVTADPLDEYAGGPTAAYSEIPPSELDAPNFDASAYVARVLAAQGLAELLRTYTRVLGEMRALDAEKKALVYDNYSRLISATETIRRMRGAMDPLTPVASTLDPAISRIYEQANGIREAMRREVGPPPGQAAVEENGDGGRERRRRRTRELAAKMLEVPRRLLETWKAGGQGGDDVYRLLEEGDAILRGEEPPRRSSGNSDD
jgi:hypothetical protein